MPSLVITKYLQPRLVTVTDYGDLVALMQRNIELNFGQAAKDNNSTGAGPQGEVAAAEKEKPRAAPFSSVISGNTTTSNSTMTVATTYYSSTYIAKKDDALMYVLPKVCGYDCHIYY